MSKTPVVFLGCPGHDQRIHYSVATALFNSTRKHTIYRQFNSTSLLAWNFNQLYAACLNLQDKHNIKWFVMLHSDIAPEMYWLDKLLNIAEKHNADLISAVMPFKDSSGITSTAIGHPYDPFSFYTRLSLRQVWDPAFPETFDINQAHEALTAKVAEPSRMPDMPLTQLLVNTGCMAIRMERPWSEKLFFTISDDIRITTEGQYVAVVEPEDWYISRYIHQAGGKVMATRAINAKHIGQQFYHSDGIWGVDVDPESMDFKQST